MFDFLRIPFFMHVLVYKKRDIQYGARTRDIGVAFMTMKSFYIHHCISTAL